ncbi:MAG: hypothetical protein N4A47_00245 [Clostridia bacterium]|jgi:hypothetical protein|nr:hypothetical protein [Clostridia bacterium]
MKKNKKNIILKLAIVLASILILKVNALAFEIDVLRGDESVDEIIYNNETLNLEWKEKNDYKYDIKIYYFNDKRNKDKYYNEAEKILKVNKIENYGQNKYVNYKVESVDADYISVQIEYKKNSIIKDKIVKTYSLKKTNLNRVRIDSYVDGIKFNEEVRYYKNKNEWISARYFGGYEIKEKSRKYIEDINGIAVVFNYTKNAAKKVLVRYIDSTTGYVIKESNRYSNLEKFFIIAEKVIGYDFEDDEIYVIKNGYSIIEYKYKKKSITSKGDNGKVNVTVRAVDEDKNIIDEEIISFDDGGLKRIYPLEIKNDDYEMIDLTSKQIEVYNGQIIEFEYEKKETMVVLIRCYDQEDKLIKQVREVYEDRKYRNIYAPAISEYELKDEKYYRVGGSKTKVVKFEYKKEKEYDIEVKVKAYYNGKIIDEEKIKIKEGMRIYAPEIDGYILEGNNNYKYVDREKTVKFYYEKGVTIKINCYYDGDLIEEKKVVIEEKSTAKVYAPEINGFKVKGSSYKKYKYIDDDLVEFDYERDASDIEITIKCYNYYSGEVIYHKIKDYDKENKYIRVYAPEIDGYELKKSSNFQKIKIDRDRVIKFYYEKD